MSAKSEAAALAWLRLTQGLTDRQLLRSHSQWLSSELAVILPGAVYFDDRVDDVQIPRPTFDVDAPGDAQE